ncbi:MAG TPA: M14 family metallopeptidase, partial [Gemmataceae bacterium]|nr:M14 family metallopeptidase [Gemmataceae bacterium]
MPFSPDYLTARDRFRAAAARLGWVTQAMPIDARGPADEELTIDTAVSPAPASAPVLVVSSGVHGVEGFFGSAVQLAALDAWAKTGAPTGVRCVFIHAVCPSGFARLRRFDEANTDLNRNFLLDGQEYTGCPPTYAALDAVLNPRRPPSCCEFFTLRALVAIAKHGLANLKQAIAGGQYEFPQGLFFGGRGPSSAHTILAKHFPGWLADSPRGVLLDFHSGLGRWGRYTLLVDAIHTPEQLDRATQWFGPGLLEPSLPEGTAYQTRGGFDMW